MAREVAKAAWQPCSRSPKLCEISIVAVPAQRRARIASVKTFETKAALIDALRKGEPLPRGIATKIAAGGWNALAEADHEKAKALLTAIQAATQRLKRIMIMNAYPTHLTRHAAALLASGAPFHRKDAAGGDDPIEMLTKAFGTHTEEVLRRLGASDNDVNSLKAGLAEIRQQLARANGGGGFGGGGGYVPSWGEQVLRSAELRSFADGGSRAKARIGIESKATITSAQFPIVPDVDREIVPLARRRVTVRALLGQANTVSNAVSYRRETGFTNAAAPVAEGVRKPESAITYEEVTAPVRTLAHWLKVSRQVVEDEEMLRSEIDTTLRAGLETVVEDQLLNGDGTGQNLHGLIPQATAFDEARREAGFNAFDVLLAAISQSEEADYVATGAIISVRDWYKLMGVKTTGSGEYIGGGPLADIPDRVWRLPVAPSNAMPVGSFLLGGLDLAAKVYTRRDATVELGYDGDDFTRNLLTMLGEERLALAVRRPEALVYGSFVAP